MGRILLVEEVGEGAVVVAAADGEMDVGEYIWRLLGRRQKG